MRLGSSFRVFGCGLSTFEAAGKGGSIVEGEVFFCFFNLFLTEGQLLYSIVLVSAKHQHESATGQRAFFFLTMGAILVKASWSLLFLLSDAVFPSRLASLLAQLIKNPPAMQETLVRFLGQEDPLEKGLATHSSILGVPWCSAGKESACVARDLGSISGLGRSPGEGKGYPLQYSGLENSMDCIVHGITKSQT